MTMIPESLSLRKIESLRDDWIRISSRIEEKKSRLTTLEITLGNAKHRIAQRPVVMSVLESMQNDAHARGIGMFEALLSKFNQEILPEIKKPVVMNLTTSRGMPSLDISVGSGREAEDLWDGGGGSLTNTMSLGLRYIALARSPLRKFMVLDEPDCWLEADRIPDLGRIVVNMSSRLNIQTLLVTHHRAEIINQMKFRIHMEKDPVVGVRISYPLGMPVWADGQRGIRCIELENMMSHKHSVLHLSPETTMITGPNHTGKSVPSAALRLMTQGRATDKLIRDDAEFCRMTITVEEGRRLRWTRSRDGSPKEVFELFEATDTDKPSRSARGERGDVPEFVREVLNIQQIQDLDVQLHHQKLPTFLLDRPASQQAAILSAGMESEHLNAVMTEYQRFYTTDRKEVEIGEREMTVLREQIARLEDLMGEGVDMNILKTDVETLMKSEDDLAQMEVMMISFDRLSNRLAHLKDGSTISLQDQPELEDAGLIESDVNLLEKLEKRAMVFATIGDIPSEETPVIEDLSLMADLVNELERLEKRMAVLGQEKPEVSADPEVVDLTEMMLLTEVFEKTEIAQRSSALRLSQANVQLDRAKVQLEMVLLKMGSTCPVCHQRMSIEHLMHETA